MPDTLTLKVDLQTWPAALQSRLTAAPPVVRDWCQNLPGKTPLDFATTYCCRPVPIAVLQWALTTLPERDTQALIQDSFQVAWQANAVALLDQMRESNQPAVERLLQNWRGSRPLTEPLLPEWPWFTEQLFAGETLCMHAAPDVLWAEPDTETARQNVIAALTPSRVHIPDRGRTWAQRSTTPVWLRLFYLSVTEVSAPAAIKATASDAGHAFWQSVARAQTPAAIQWALMPIGYIFNARWLNALCEQDPDTLHYWPEAYWAQWAAPNTPASKLDKPLCVWAIASQLPYLAHPEHQTARDLLQQVLTWSDWLKHPQAMQLAGFRTWCLASPAYIKTDGLYQVQDTPAPTFSALPPITQNLLVALGILGDTVDLQARGLWAANGLRDENILSFGWRQLHGHCAQPVDWSILMQQVALQMSLGGSLVDMARRLWYNLSPEHPTTTAPGAPPDPCCLPL